MPNNSKSAIQPLLADAKELVRFKGCYLLESVKTKSLTNGHKIKVATFSDVENTGTLEVRLLGDSFQHIEQFTLEYLQIEIAFKRLKKVQFYYLAWFESIERTKTFINCEVRHSVQKQLFKVDLIRRANNIVSISTRKLCKELIQEIIQTKSTVVLHHLVKTQHQLSDAELCLKLTQMALGKAENIWDIGFFLSMSSDQGPYELWENQLLGSR